MLTKSVCVFACVALMAACGGERHVEASTAPVALPASPSSQPTAVKATPAFEGKYTLDRARTKEAALEEIDKLPPDTQKFAKAAVDMIDEMDVTLEIVPQGAAKIRIGLRHEVTERVATWKAQGDELVMTDAKSGAPTTCKKSGPTLTCIETRKSGPSTMIFQAQ